jgi:LemA protein
VVELITIILIVVVVLVLLGLVGWFFAIYNRFFNLKNSAEATLGQIRVAMKKRLDMIEQLLGSVRSYATFEKETLARVTELRASVAKGGPADLDAAEAESRSIFGRLFAVAEAYPDLKTSTVVQELTGAVRGVEDEIGRQRYTYNNVAQQLNTMVDVVPSNIVARLIGMQKLEYLQFEEAIERPPTIEF